MKTFEILLKLYTTVVVTAEDEAAALDIASDVCPSPSGFEFDEGSIDEVLDTDRQIADAIRHSPFHDYESRAKPYTAEDC